MQDPELYSKVSDIPRRDAEELMSKYLGALHWRGTEDETVLDVGCANGEVTWEILRPRLPPGIRVFGADIAPAMVTYAAEKYPDGNFFQLDIGTKNLPEHLNTAFDHVVSFYCLHWIQDQRQVMQNIYNMLKPEGDLFAYYLGISPVFDMFYNSSQLKKWNHYIPEARKHTPMYQHEDHIEEYLHNILTDVGFKVSLLKAIPRKFIYSDLEQLKVFYSGVHPYYAKIPDDLKEEFMNDNMKELFKLKSIQNANLTNTKEIVIPHTLIIIIASKINIPK